MKKTKTTKRWPKNKPAERKRCPGCGEWSLRFYKRVREWHCPLCLAKRETGP